MSGSRKPEANQNISADLFIYFRMKRTISLSVIALLFHISIKSVGGGAEIDLR